MPILYTRGEKVKTVNIIHIWIKCLNYAHVVKRLNMTIVYTSG